VHGLGHRLNHAADYIGILPDHPSRSHRARKLKRDFEFRHVDNGFQAAFSPSSFPESVAAVKSTLPVITAALRSPPTPLS
jgi:hypothetical protein